MFLWSFKLLMTIFLVAKIPFNRSNLWQVCYYHKIQNGSFQISQNSSEAESMVITSIEDDQRKNFISNVCRIQKVQVQMYFNVKSTHIIFIIIATWESEFANTELAHVLFNIHKRPTKGPASHKGPSYLFCRPDNSMILSTSRCNPRWVLSLGTN